MCNSVFVARAQAENLHNVKSTYAGWHRFLKPMTLLCLRLLGVCLISQQRLTKKRRFRNECDAPLAPTGRHLECGVRVCNAQATLDAQWLCEFLSEGPLP